jgi:hypothetical protein
MFTKEVEEVAELKSATVVMMIDHHFSHSEIIQNFRERSRGWTASPAKLEA